MAIKKGSFTFEFLYDDTDVSDEAVQNMPISVILEECDSGPMIGAVADCGVAIEDVPADEVEAQLLNMGNDGTFFGNPEE